MLNRQALSGTCQGVMVSHRFNVGKLSMRKLTSSVIIWASVRL